LEQFYNC